MDTYIPPPGPTKDGFVYCQELLRRAFVLTPKNSQERQHQETEDLTDGTVVALRLNQVVQSAPPENQEDLIYGICLGMMYLANTHPAYIDEFLKLFFGIIELSPSQRLNGPTATFASHLLMQITEIYTGGYRNQDLWPQNKTHPGTEDPLDGCMLNYTKEEVEERLKTIIEDRMLQANEANSTIVKGAIFARFTVLVNQVRPAWLKRYGINVQRFDDILRKSEVPGEKWIKADFIGTLIRLRGYAKSVSESFAANEYTHGKMQEWQGLLKRWLYDPELNKTNDPMVKHHVILVLKNFKEGPFNETSEELFRSEDWVSC